MPLPPHHTPPSPRTFGGIAGGPTSTVGPQMASHSQKKIIHLYIFYFLVLLVHPRWRATYLFLFPIYYKLMQDNGCECQM
jgi:hypothetical protein